MAKDRSRPRGELAGYESIAEAVRESERGRWFLEEHARRTRSADLQLLFEAVATLQRMAGEAPRDDAGLGEVAALAAGARRLAQGIGGDERDLHGERALARAGVRLRDLACALADVGGPPELSAELAAHAAEIASASDLARRRSEGMAVLAGALDEIERRLVERSDVPETPEPWPPKRLSGIRESI